MQRMTYSFYIGMITMLFLACVIFPQPVAAGDMTEMADAEMEQIYGQDGITIAVRNVYIFNFIDNFTYSAPPNEFGTCGGVLSLQNIKMHARDGGPGFYNFDFGTTDQKSGMIFFDVLHDQVAAQEDWDFGTVTPVEKLFTSTYSPWWDQEIGFLIGNIKFGSCDNVKDLGWADIGVFDLRSFQYYSAPHGDGIDFEYDLELHIDHLMYGYKDNPPTGCEALSFSNIHIGQTFGFDFGALGGDDPASPSTWYTDPAINTPIGEFKIGDMFGDVASSIHSNPATYDVATIGDCPDPSIANHLAMVLNLPIQGSIRFEKAEFGSTDFGPGAIDGIHAYRLEAFLIPGDL